MLEPAHIVGVSKPTYALATRAALTGGVTHGKRARGTPHAVRIRRIRAAGLLATTAAIATAISYQSLASSSSTASATTVFSSPTMSSRTGATSPISVPRSNHLSLRRERPGALGEADGAVPDGTTVFDDGVPAVANLKPPLLAALRQAATDAGNDGVEFLVDSGWRSAAYQEQLLQQAVLKYGSTAKAARWVATPNTSAHVSGNAVDIGLSDATAWLSRYGAHYGLCQIYRNEAWHYELRAGAREHGCPRMYADPAHDPRMQQ